MVKKQNETSRLISIDMKTGNVIDLKTGKEVPNSELSKRIKEMRKIVKEFRKNKSI